AFAQLHAGLLHPALLLDLVSLAVEQQFHRQSATRLGALLVEAMDGAHHVAAAIRTDPSRFQPIVPVEPALGTAAVLVHGSDLSIRGAVDGDIDEPAGAQARSQGPALVPIQTLLETPDQSDGLARFLVPAEPVIEVAPPSRRMAADPVDLEWGRPGKQAAV